VLLQKRTNTKEKKLSVHVVVGENTSWDEVTLRNEETKPVALSIVELRLAVILV